MWKRGGQSSALDRAQALLSAKRTSRGVGQSTHGSAAKTKGTVDGSINSRPAAQNTHTLLSDLSDLSSLSSAPEHGAVTAGSAAPQKTQERNENSKDLRPQSSLGGAGSRFLKKAPPPVTISSQSPVSKSHMQQMPEPRYVSSSQRGSQTAALSRLAQIESRFRSRKQSQEQARQAPKAAHNLNSDLGFSAPTEAVTQSLEPSVPISAQSSSEQSLKGKRFLKNKAAAAVDSTNTATSGSPKGPDAGVMSWSRAAAAAAAAAVPLVSLDTKSVRATRGLSLESDEEDMRKLLGDSLDSENSFSRPEVSFIKKPDKMLSHKVHSTPPPAAVQPPRSPASPSHRRSPFRFTGQPQAHFSPSALSPSPSPPCVSPTLSGRLSSPRRLGSPQRAVSAMSGPSEVQSLEELFPVQPASEDLHSDISVVSSEDFKVNVMSLDDLIPASVGFTEETPEIQRQEHNLTVAGSSNRHKELPSYKKGEQQQQRQQEEEEEEKEDVLDYHSDFESESRTEQNCSASQVSEQLTGDRDGDGEEPLSEVRDETSDSDVSHGRTEDDYSSTFSHPSRSRVSQTQSISRSRDSRSPESPRSWTSSEQKARRAAARGVLKEAAVQTQPESMAYAWSTGVSASGPALGLTYMTPPSVAAHTLSAERVEALSAHNPAVFVLNEMLKQQLATTRQFIESSRRLHSSLVRSLEPPNYRYTTLEDTREVNHTSSTNTHTTTF
uniref:DUF4614 domain-containing protein n=1 Tax=Anabas testudineus TaxID=64144 RepID=A0AAQ6IKT3_ANATE